MIREIGAGAALLHAVTLGGCASSAATPASLAPLDATQCEAFAAGMGPSGKSMIESFDSLYAAGLAGQRQRAQDPATRLEKPPTLLNGRALAGFMTTYYPPALVRAQRGGRALLAMLVRTDGTADPIRVLRSSGVTELDLASVEVARHFRFSPGVFRGCPVFTFVMMPVTWNPGQAPPSSGRE